MEDTQNEIVMYESSDGEFCSEKLIDDHTLVALTILIEKSKPEEEEMMITVVMNCICGN